MKYFSRLLWLLCVVALGIITTTVVDAAYGRGAHYGYFNNNYATSGDFVIPGGITISGASERNKVDNLIGTLYSWESGNQQHRDGADFIINTMFGRSAPGNGKGRSGELEALRTRLYNFVDGGGTIIRNSAYSYSINTMYQYKSFSGTGYFDDAWYYASGTGPAYVFSRAGIEYYVIKESCANPLGDLPGIPPGQPPYDINGSSYINMPSPPAYPGASIPTTHYLWNSGPNASPSIAKNIFNTDPGRTWESAVPGTYGVHGIFPVGYMGTYGSTLTIPASAIAGQNYCQMIGWDPDAYLGGVQYRNGRSSPACITVIYKYNLTPVVTQPPALATILTPITFNYSVSNAGPTKTYSTSIGRRTIVIPPGTAIPAGFSSAHDGTDCSWYTAQGAGITCSTSIEPQQIFPTGVTNTTNPSETYTIPASMQTGTKICRALSVKSYDETQPGANRDSIVRCVTVSRSPISVVSGSDASAGGALEGTACTGTGGFTGVLGNGFGSFGEYGLIATGTISEFYSAARVSSNTLTFANSPAPTLGEYSTTHCIINYVSRYANQGSAGTLTTTSFTVSGPSKSYNVTSDVTLNAATGIKRQYLIYAPGQTITIGGNQEYDTAGITSFADAPSLIIIAKQININKGVNRIDGVLYATDYVLTCTDSGTSPTPTSAATKAALWSGGPCADENLNVNGAVITPKKVVPARTKGGTAASEAPSEIYRLRPEAFLTPVEASNSGILTTVSETELPPRN